VTETEFSWLQKRHWKVVGSFSFYDSDSVSGVFLRRGGGWGMVDITFFAACGFEAFLRLPMVEVVEVGCGNARYQKKEM
jgi:hypothetical protein